MKQPPLLNRTSPLVGDEPIYHWIDGQRYRWKRYSNRYHRSKCLFYLVPDPEET